MTSPLMYFGSSGTPATRGASASISIATLAELPNFSDAQPNTSGQLYYVRAEELLYVYSKEDTQPADSPEVVPASTLAGGGNYILVGGAGGSFDRTIPFTFETASPLLAALLEASGYVERADIVITTVFDDPASSLTLGSPTSPSAIFAVGDADPTSLGQTTTDEIFAPGVAGAIELTIDPAASTQGAGYVHLVGRGA